MAGASRIDLILCEGAIQRTDCCWFAMATENHTLKLLHISLLSLLQFILQLLVQLTTLLELIDKVEFTLFESLHHR